MNCKKSIIALIICGLVGNGLFVGEYSSHATSKTTLQKEKTNKEEQEKGLSASDELTEFLFKLTINKRDLEGLHGEGSSSSCESNGEKQEYLNHTGVYG